MASNILIECKRISTSSILKWQAKILIQESALDLSSSTTCFKLYAKLILRFEIKLHDNVQ